MKNKQRGSAEIIVLILVLIAAIGFVAWWVWSQNRPDNTQKQVSVGVFSPSLTTQIADAQGFIAEENLTVDYPQVTGSEQQFRSLRDGEYDLILTAPDNVLQYRLNKSNALGSTFDVQSVAGTNKGQGLSLVVRPEITSYEGLRGKDLAVDSPDSGFAYVLYQILLDHGLQRGTDYNVVEAGGNSGRLDALLNGDFAGTLLLSGLELRAQEQGMTILESATESIPNYLGGVVAGRESWMKENRDAVERLLRAYQKANDWLFDPANRDAVIDMVMQQQQASREFAEKIYEVQTSPSVGIIQNQQISQDEFRTVLNLRQDWKGFDEPQDLDFLQTPESGLYDTSYLK